MDDAIYFVGLINFDDIYGGMWWKKFCIQIVNLPPPTGSVRADNFTAEYCPTGQSSGSYKQTPKEEH